MTDLEQIAAEMELSERRRLALAAELLRLRRLHDTARRFRRRLPHQVQSALDAPAVATQLDPPPEPGSAPALI